MIRLFLALVLILCAVSARAQNSTPNQPPVLTLDEAVALAQAHNRLIKDAQLTAAIGDDQIAKARTYRFPSVSFYGLGSQLFTPVDFTF
ncbi:MAG TPA: hypothetical protein VKE24_05690, partial [Candidatus Acidoferrales bacterium]|nr:hypothetical protein [Candidatus Acidoferrales bacterium]